MAHLRSRHGVALPRHSGPSIVTTGAATGSGRGRVRPRAASAELERDERSDQLPALLSSRPPEPTRPCSDLLRDRLRGGLPVRGVSCSERTEVVERELRSELYSYDALLSPSPLERLRLVRGGREKAKEAPGIASHADGAPGCYFCRLMIETRRGAISVSWEKVRGMRGAKGAEVARAARNPVSRGCGAA